MVSDKSIVRCQWVSDDPLYIQYHDDEWGVPVFDQQKLFEFLVLECMQAGLSWITILKKRDNYRRCFDRFDARKIVQYGPVKIQALLVNTGIIRNRLKVNAIVTNAQAYLRFEETGDSFSDFLWGFVDGSPIANHWRCHTDIPASTPLSAQLSKALKQRGFKFVGATICYAFMQAVGMVNDHTTDCFRYEAP
jgi:DNA-3-methyladenine glycosylase I